MFDLIYRVAAPVGVDQDPTFEKKPNPDPTFEKKNPYPHPTFEKKPDADP